MSHSEENNNHFFSKPYIHEAQIKTELDKELIKRRISKSFHLSKKMFSFKGHFRQSEEGIMREDHFKIFPAPFAPYYSMRKPRLAFAKIIGQLNTGESGTSIQLRSEPTWNIALAPILIFLCLFLFFIDGFLVESLFLLALIIGGYAYTIYKTRVDFSSVVDRVNSILQPDPTR